MTMLTNQQILARNFEEFHDTGAVKADFMNMWPLLQKDGIEQLIALLSAYTIGAGRVELTVNQAVALFLVGFSEGCPDIKAAWLNAVDYMSNEPNDR